MRHLPGQNSNEAEWMEKDSLEDRVETRHVAIDLRPRNTSKFESSIRISHRPRKDPIINARYGIEVVTAETMSVIHTDLFT